MTVIPYLTKDGDFLGASRYSFRKQKSMTGCTYWFFKARPVVSVTNVAGGMLENTIDDLTQKKQFSALQLENIFVDNQVTNVINKYQSSRTDW